MFALFLAVVSGLKSFQVRRIFRFAHGSVERTWLRAMNTAVEMFGQFIGKQQWRRSVGRCGRTGAVANRVHTQPNTFPSLEFVAMLLLLPWERPAQVVLRC